MGSMSLDRKYEIRYFENLESHIKQKEEELKEKCPLECYIALHLNTFLTKAFKEKYKKWF